MPNNEPDSGKQPFSDDPNRAPVTEAEFRKIFNAFCKIPKKCQQAYLLHLLHVSVPVIAQNLKITFDQASQRIEQSEIVLKNHFGPEVAWERIEVLATTLFIITVNTPYPFVKILRLIETSLAIRDTFLKEELRQNELARYRDATQSTLSELITARQIVLEMEPKSREVFLLAEYGNMARFDIATMLGINFAEVEGRFEQACEFLSLRMEKLVVGYLKIRAKHKGVPSMSRAEREAAKIAFNLLPPSFRAVYKRHLVSGVFLPELGDFDSDDQETVRMTRNLMAGRIRMTIYVWLRLALNGVPPLGLALHMRDHIDTIEVDSTKGMGAIEFALNLLESPQREALVLQCGERLEPPEIEIIQFVDEGVMAKRLHDAMALLHGRMEHLLYRAMQQRRTGINLAGLRPHEFEFAQQLMESVPKNCRKSYRGFLLTELSLTQIGEKLGITAKQVRLRVAKAKDAITQKILQELTQTLDRIEDGRKVSRRILDRLRRKDAARGFVVPIMYTSSAREELEAKNTFDELDEDSQEVAVLFFGHGKDEFDVASTMGIRTADVNDKLKNMREMFRRRMTSMVLGYLRTEESPGSVRMTPSAGKVIVMLAVAGKNWTSE